ncbi:MAG: hypothetical protein EAX96_04140 [Candidatus Lokiarchaeota archaeon]|nr:hypothetical protein [Candidatus Lokiarchaeota archaeon]
MEKVTDLLDENEEILWKGRPDKRAFLISLFIEFPALSAIVIAPSGIIAIFEYFRGLDTGNFDNFILNLSMFLVSTLILGILMIIIYRRMRLKNIEYALTKDKIFWISSHIDMDVRGFCNVKFMNKEDMNIVKIKNISYAKLESVQEIKIILKRFCNDILFNHKYKGYWTKFLRVSDISDLINIIKNELKFQQIDTAENYQLFTR